MSVFKLTSNHLCYNHVPLVLNATGISNIQLKDNYTRIYLRLHSKAVGQDDQRYNTALYT